MRNILSLLSTASLLVLACETDHQTVARVNAAGAGGVTAFSAGGARNSGGASSISPTGGATTTGGSAAQGGTATEGGAGSGIGGTITGGRTSQAGNGGVTTTGGRSSQAGSGGVTTTGGNTAQAGSGTCGGEFVACGCGCCGGVTPNFACYYPSLGDSLASIISADSAARASTNCAMVGCSMGQRSVCCNDAATDPSDTSTYSAGLAIGGGYDTIRIEKHTPSGQCIVLTMVSPNNNASSLYRMTLPNSWGVARASVRDCAASAESPSGIGGLGSIVFQKATGACAIDVHATLFLAPNAGSLQTVRFDADNVSLEGVTGLTVCS